MCAEGRAWAYFLLVSRQEVIGVVGHLNSRFSYVRHAMFSLRKWIGPAAVLGLTLLVFSASIANGQNPYAHLLRGLAVQQAAYNIATIGQALSYVPPYALGNNVYPVAMPYPVATPSVNPYATMYANPYAS